MDRNSLGAKGEEAAAEYLKGKGYKILDRNFRSRFGEIDIIAEGYGYLCFVEVKTRSYGYIARGIESVTASKQMKIIKTAEYYNLCKGNIAERRELQPRFDCIEVYAEKSGKLCEINHIENAFY